MFLKRSEETELMDDLSFTGDEMRITLKELETINRWLGGNNITISGLNILLSGNDTPTTIADIGCGRGDMLKLMAQWAHAKGLKISLTGIDANRSIIDYAKENTVDYPEITYDCVNIFSDDFQNKRYDIIACSLFTHHFTDEELVALLKILKNQTKLGIIINDLHRHWLAYHSIKYITAAFSGSHMIKNDAPLSVLRSFSREDWSKILSLSGIRKYSLTWKWAFRWQLIIPTLNNF